MKLICMHSKKEFVLDSTPLILGRGAETGCNDKRVSRKHALLSWTVGNGLTLSSLHTNPCFVMKNGKPPVIILKRDESTRLENGDYIALIPDSTWFQVIEDSTVESGGIEEEGPPSPVFLHDEPHPAECQTPQTNGVGISSSPRYSPYSSPKHESFDGEKTPSDLGQLSPRSDGLKELDCPPTPENVIGTSSSLSPLAAGPSGSPLAARPSGSPLAAATSGFTQMVSTPTNSYRPGSPCRDKIADFSCGTPTIVARPSLVLPYSPKFIIETETPTKVVAPSSSSCVGVPSSSSKPQSSRKRKTRKLPDWIGRPPPKKAHIGDDDNATKNDSSEEEALAASPIDPAIYDEDTNDAFPQALVGNVAQEVTVKAEPSSQGQIANLPSSPSASNATETATAPGNVVKVEVKADPDDVSSSTDQGQPRLPDPSSANMAPAAYVAPQPVPTNPLGAVMRDPCRYGASCYRRNPHHKIKYSHPNDSDWVERPPCRYGAQCYRTSRAHREAFIHPSPAVRVGRRPRQNSDDESEDEDEDDYNDDEETDEDPYATDDDEDNNWTPTSNDKEE